MAKHASARLLHPSQVIAPKKPPTSFPKVLPIRHDPGPLPPSTVLYRKPIPSGPPLPASCNASNLPIIQHGQHIYLYNNIFTNQVVYSLTRHLNNAASLAQLPFLGKKTQPSHLRKDLWTPFALATFPSPHAGISAYRKLREFRRLHETAYPLDTIRNPDSPKHLLPRKQRSKVLMNQKANSIADLAAVLLQQEKGVSPKRRERWDRVSQRINRLISQKNLSGPENESIRRKQRLEKVNVVKEFSGVQGVQVHWVDMRDTEFASRWPRQVVHVGLAKSRYTAAWPARDVAKEEKEKAEKEKEKKERGGKEEEEETPSDEALLAGVATLPRRSWREIFFGPRDKVAAARAAARL